MTTKTEPTTHFTQREAIAVMLKAAKEIGESPEDRFDLLCRIVGEQQDQIAQEQQVNAANTATITALKRGLLLLLAEEHRQAQMRLSRARYSQDYGQKYVDALASITVALGDTPAPAACAAPLWEKAGATYRDPEGNLHMASRNAEAASPKPEAIHAYCEHPATDAARNKCLDRLLDA